MFSFRFRFRYRFYLHNLIINYINNALEWGMCNSPSPSTSTAPSSSLCSPSSAPSFLSLLLLWYFYFFAFVVVAFLVIRTFYACLRAIHVVVALFVVVLLVVVAVVVLVVWHLALASSSGCSSTYSKQLHTTCMSVCVCLCLHVYICVCVSVHRAIRLVTFVLVRARWPAVHTLKGLWRRCCCCCVGCGCALDSSCTHDENKKSRFFSPTTTNSQQNYGVCVCVYACASVRARVCVYERAPLGIE